MILAIIIPILYLMGWLSTIRFVISISDCTDAMDRGMVKRP